MVSISLLQLVSYVSSVALAMVLIAKAVKYATAPMHLRWELYPVAHEKGREYGGSYYEELDWWTKRRVKSIIADIKFMLTEIFLMKAIYYHNRKLWYFSYPFHVGLYLFVAWLILLLIGAVTMLAGVSVSAGSSNSWGTLIYYLTLVAGVTGLVVGIGGCIGLLVKRIADEDLRLYTAPIDYFNLLFILAVLASGIYAWFSSDQTFSTLREYVKSLLTFSPTAIMDSVTSAHIILLSLFLIYMPFTPMIHFLAKYFMYHRVRWDNEPNLRGSVIEKKIKKPLDQPVTWSAPHIQSGKSWREVMSETKSENGTESNR